MPDASAKITAYFEHRMDDLSQQLANGQISLQDWHIGMRQEIRDSFAMQLKAGSPNNTPTANDYLKLGPQVQAQDRFLSQFARDIQSGDINPSAIGSRAKMYARSSGQMFWDAKTGNAKLPAYPKDGSTPCRHNCDCSWRNNGDGTYTWVLGEKDHCDICPQRAIDWSPFDPSLPRDPSLFMAA